MKRTTTGTGSSPADTKDTDPSCASLPPTSVDKRNNTRGSKPKHSLSGATVSVIAYPSSVDLATMRKSASRLNAASTPRRYLHIAAPCLSSAASTSGVSETGTRGKPSTSRPRRNRFCGVQMTLPAGRAGHLRSGADVTGATGSLGTFRCASQARGSGCRPGAGAGSVGSWSGAGVVAVGSWPGAGAVAVGSWRGAGAVAVGSWRGAGAVAVGSWRGAGAVAVGSCPGALTVGVGCWSSCLTVAFCCWPGAGQPPIPATQASCILHSCWSSSWLRQQSLSTSANKCDLSPLSLQVLLVPAGSTAVAGSKLKHEDPPRDVDDPTRVI
mmetsp:Transcript_110867/g.254056  ORF Transcript_110867/g.254056 Transcript_110867/m.254056 type:complete len:326 (+) Transcript_110867:171-1148(+)